MGRPTPLGPAPRRLTPLFRDRDELPASGDLGVELRAALKRSLRLVVACSPASARSVWVNEEILAFKRLYGEGGVLALIVAGEPGASAKGRPDEECFPPALRFVMGADGELTDQPAHPIAADMRKEGDGRRGALLKLIAGLAAVPLDELVQREAQRRMQSLSALAAGLAVGVALMGGLALYANTLRIEADHQRRVAERETAAAKAASDFLVGTFALSNPATENPRTVTALTILSRSAERARAELAKQPAIQVRLLDAVGRAYNNLGLFDESKSALEPAKGMARAVGPDGALMLLTLATTYFDKGDLKTGLSTVAEAERLLGADDGSRPDLRGQVAETRARLEWASADIAASDRDYERALAYYTRAKDLKPQILGRTYLNHGVALSNMGQHERARQSLQHALAIYQQATGERSRLTGQAYAALAQVELADHRLPQATAAITQAVSVLSGVLDNDNPILADVLSKRGEILLEQGAPAQAAADLSRSVEILRRAYKGPHYMIGDHEGYLALAQSQLGRTDEALATLDDAKRNYDESYKHLHPNHGDLLVQRAQVLKRAGRTAEARADCAAGLDILRRLLGANADFYKVDAAMCAKV